MVKFPLSRVASSYRCRRDVSEGTLVSHGVPMRSVSKYRYFRVPLKIRVLSNCPSVCSFVRSLFVRPFVVRS